MNCELSVSRKICWFNELRLALTVDMSTQIFLIVLNDRYPGSIIYYSVQQNLTS